MIAKVNHFADADSCYIREHGVERERFPCTSAIAANLI